MFNASDFNNLISIPSGQLTLTELVAKVANFLVMSAGIIAFIYLVYTGILYMTAGNNPDQAKKAQGSLINVIIGIVIITLSYVIVRTIGGLIVGVIK